MSHDINQKAKSIAVIGSGPCGLMIADELSKLHSVTLFERRPALGRKLLIAGSSGLNITHTLPTSEFSKQYLGGSPPGFTAAGIWEYLLKQFSPQAWIDKVHTLGHETFIGTSRRVFLKEMKASQFLNSWRDRLRLNNVIIKTNLEWMTLEKQASGPFDLGFKDLMTNQASLEKFDLVCLALGGGNYDPEHSSKRWLDYLSQLGLHCEDFSPSNCGYQVSWPLEFLQEAEGLPLKNIEFKNSLGKLKGELVITDYGLEGTPIYTFGNPGPATVDLKPDLTEDEILQRLESVKENLSISRRIKKNLNLCPAALALLFHFPLQTPVPNHRPTLGQVAHWIKNFPLLLLEPQSLVDAISTRGGLCWSELTQDFEIKKIPGIYAAGEMLNWDAPTGGFLIQGCVTQGWCVAQDILNKVRTES